MSEIEISIILLNDTNLIMEEIKDQDKNSPLVKKGLQKQSLILKILISNIHS